MEIRTLSLGLAVLLAGCARHPSPLPAPMEDDKLIAFPRFYEYPATHVGAGGVPYELDGTMLRALLIAANHFRPPSNEEQPCWDRQEAQRYRVIRQGDLVFVEISEDPEFCGSGYISLDSGATYAISADGRILRHITGAHPDRIFGSPPDPYDGGAGPIRPLPPPAPSAVPDGGPAGVPSPVSPGSSGEP
jgi:hypothetical protein